MYLSSEAETRAAEDAACSILGCESSDSIETIRKRYLQLAKIYHPDTLAGKDLPAEFVQLAQEKFRSIKEAYDTLITLRGGIES